MSRAVIYDLADWCGADYRDGRWRYAFFAPVSRIAAMADPTDTPPWEDAGDLSPAHVAAARAEMACATPEQIVAAMNTPGAAGHAARIAVLLDDGWSDAISIEFNYFSAEQSLNWPIIDGNHRLYAAILRGDRVILVTIGGSIETAEALLGVNLDKILV